LFVLLKSSAGRCVVITGTVSFPLFRSLRQLRRRTIRPDPRPVNTFCEKNQEKSAPGYHTQAKPLIRHRI
ncbi:hypothetical protein J9978_00515, partial [Chromobacterium violaceum]|uniref:hypothetical protein n=1 Tax=Chromobacterium violaceum TaxID=536 RepID=UPI001B32E596